MLVLNGLYQEQLVQRRHERIAPECTTNNKQ